MEIDRSQVMENKVPITDVGISEGDIDEILKYETEEELVKEKQISINRKESLVGKFVKRVVDIIGGLFGVILLIPITIVISIANFFSRDNGPVFFVQERIGKNGKLFKMYKFRSMVVGADEKLVKYLEKNEEAREEYRINKKLKDDPRVTHIGEFIRKTSIDEFPQFLNILKGDMSLVGPRPYLPREQKEMGTYYDLIVKHKPGLTGLWQVNGRSDVSFEERLLLDLRYCNNSSLFYDAKILLKTFGSVVKKEGAQ